MRHEKPVNYAKLDQRYRAHHERWKKRVQDSKLTCQECGGGGQYINDSIDMGGDDIGPIVFHIMDTCGWCEGTGRLDNWRRGFWLRCKKRKGNGKSNS